MSQSFWVAFGRLLPGDVEQFERDLAVLGGADGVVFLDPTDGIHPVFLAHRVRRIRPEAAVVVPLVARDANRTSLVGQARAAVALGAASLLLLSGHLDPANPARTVYELDALQMLRHLRRADIGLPVWVSSRCSTPAERARAGTYARAGAVRCLAPWEPDMPLPAEALLPVTLSVPESHWSQGRLPGGDEDLVLEVSPGRGAEAAACIAGLSRGAA